MPTTTWIWRRHHGTPYYVYRWRCGADQCFGQLVCDDFGTLVYPGLALP